MKETTAQMLKDVRVLRSVGSWEGIVPEWAQARAKQLGLASTSPKVIEWALFQIIDDLEANPPQPVATDPVVAGESETPNRLKEIGTNLSSKVSTSVVAAGSVIAQQTSVMAHQAGDKIKSFGSYLSSRISSKMANVTNNVEDNGNVNKTNEAKDSKETNPN